MATNYNKDNLPGLSNLGTLVEKPKKMALENEGDFGQRKWEFRGGQAGEFMRRTKLVTSCRVEKCVKDESKE